MTANPASGGVARSPVARTVLYSAVTSVITFLVTDALHQPVAISFILSVLIGGIAMLVRLLVGFDRRLAAVEELARTGQTRTERLVGDAFAKINDATELFGSIEASALQTDLVTQLVRRSTEITPSSPPLIYRFVRSQIREMSDFLKEMAEGGDVTYYGEDRDWLLGLTRHAGATIDAISLASVDRGLWHSEIGQRYLDAQRQAVDGHRVRIRRLFILDKRDPMSADGIRAIRAEQEKLGIQVRVLQQESIPPTLRVQVLDFIVFDGVLSYETTSAAAVNGTERPAVAETRLVLRDSRVLERVQVFAQLWEAAHGFGQEDGG